MNTGGPAFPGTLLDWYAGQETIGDEELGWPICEHYAGPRPSGDWTTNPVGWYEWNARWRAGIKYTRAAAMLAEKARREATGKDSLTVQDHCPDAAKMIALEAANRELVDALAACDAAFVKFSPEEESACGMAWAAARSALAKHKGAA